MLNRLLTLSSFANVLGGGVLFLTWAVNWATDPGRHVPFIVLAIGGSMMIQGLYTAGYALGWWKAWGNVASGALLAGQLIAGCVGVGMLVNGIISNAQHADQEMAPVMAGLMIAANALLALVYLYFDRKMSLGGLNPGKRSLPL